MEYVTRIREQQIALGAFLSVIRSTNSSVQNERHVSQKIHTKNLNIKKASLFGLSVTILSEYKIELENCVYSLLKIR